MNHELIRVWLNLPVGSWPPDHYQLLGLKRGESDPVVIERHAQQRLDKIHCYQLAHPEPATEALNRLAQAYLCLTEPAVKQRYDIYLQNESAVSIVETDSAQRLPCVSTDTPIPGKLSLPGRSRRSSENPPPLPTEMPQAAGEIVVPGITPTEEPSGEEILDDAAIEATLPPLMPPAEMTGGLRVCPLEEAARSRQARIGLCTRRGILRRIQTLRQVLRAWNNVGRLLAAPPTTRKASLKGRTQALARNLQKVEQLLAVFPPILGQAGQPGFLVISLLEQELTSKKLQSLKSEQRDKLVQDWQAGSHLLRAHARLLSELVAEFQGLGPAGRVVHALRSAMTHQPQVASVAITLVASNLILWGYYLSRWWAGRSLWPW